MAKLFRIFNIVWKKSNNFLLLPVYWNRRVLNWIDSILTHALDKPSTPHFKVKNLK